MDGVVDGHDVESLHACLKGANGVAFGDGDLGALRAEGLHASFADVSEPADEAFFATEHHVGGAHEGVDEGVTASVEVVELALGDGIVDVDGRKQEMSLCRSLIQSMHAGCRFLADAADGADDGLPEVVALDLAHVVKELQNGAKFLRIGGTDVGNGAGQFVFVAQVEQEGGVAPVVDDKRRPDESAGLFAVPVKEECLHRTPPVFGEGFAFPCEHGNAAELVLFWRVLRPPDDACRRVILGRENVARRPSDGGAEFDEGLDEDGRLNRHVQRAHNPRPGERLLAGKFRADGAQTGHLVERKVHVLTSVDDVVRAQIAHFVWQTFKQPKPRVHKEFIVHAFL